MVSLESYTFLFFSSQPSNLCGIYSELSSWIERNLPFMLEQKVNNEHHGKGWTKRSNSSRYQNYFMDESKSCVYQLIILKSSLKKRHFSIQSSEEIYQIYGFLFPTNCTGPRMISKLARKWSQGRKWFLQVRQQKNIIGVDFKKSLWISAPFKLSSVKIKGRILRHVSSRTKR